MATAGASAASASASASASSAEVTPKSSISASAFILPFGWAMGQIALAIKLFEAYFRVVGICAFVLWSKFLYTFFPQVQRRVLDRRMEHRPKRMWSAIKSEQEWGKNFFATTEMIKNRYKAWIQEPYREAQLNSLAPNPTVVSAKTGEKVPLLSMAKEGRPLILNFGSCT
jgi:hypothetical protein